MSFPLYMSDTESNSIASAIPCPLCRCIEPQAVDELSRAALMAAWEHFGIRFSPPAMASLGETESLTLWRCAACDFHYFDPEFAGTDAFYADLQQQKSNYYPPSCPAFYRAVEFAREHELKTVLDVGCGTGAFLDLARGAGRETHGLEFNSQAAEVARRNGHDVIPDSMDSLHRRRPEFQCDLVTAFEVLEHVPAPREFVKEMSALVRDGGFLALAVPNRRGLHGWCDLDPHQWPPHHITRWRLEDLVQIGKLAGLTPAASGGDLLLGGEIDHFVRLQEELIKVMGLGPERRRVRFPKWLTYLYRKLGLKFVAPHLGPSIYAFFQRTQAPAP